MPSQVFPISLISFCCHVILGRPLLRFLSDVQCKAVFTMEAYLLSHTHTHIQEKTQRLNFFAKQVGLNISSKKTKIMALNTTNRRPVQIDNEELPYTDRFTYRGSIIIRDGGNDLDTQSPLNKARNTLNMMNKVWHSSFYSTLTRLKLYDRCVLSTLLYGSEFWRWTEKGLSKLSTFHTKSLQHILLIFWPNVISNKDLFERSGTEPMATILMTWHLTGCGDADPHNSLKSASSA